MSVATMGQQFKNYPLQIYMDILFDTHMSVEMVSPPGAQQLFEALSTLYYRSVRFK